MNQYLGLAVSALRDLPQLDVPDFKVALGAEATKDAFLRLTTWFQRGMTSGNFSIRRDSDGTRGGAAATSLNEHDVLPLTIAVFVDLVLLFLAFTKPRDPFEESRQRMQELASKGQSPFRRFFKMLSAAEGGGGSNGSNNLDQAWLRLAKRSVRIGSRQYFVLPTDTDDQEVQLMKMFFGALLDDGQITYTWPWTKLLLRWKLTRRDPEACEHSGFDVYQMRRGSYAELMFSSVVEMDEVDIRPQPPRMDVPRRPGTWGRFRNFFRRRRVEDGDRIDDFDDAYGRNPRRRPDARQRGDRTSRPMPPRSRRQSYPAGEDEEDVDYPQSGWSRRDQDEETDYRQPRSRRFLDDEPDDRQSRGRRSPDEVEGPLRPEPSFREPARRPAAGRDGYVPPRRESRDPPEPRNVRPVRRDGPRLDPMLDESANGY